ncbi:MAG: DUF4177 domain-containing protein [Clostridia bacterium]|nr:DUF4177 domain-containing protein [Clostridia bacterium]
MIEYKVVTTNVREAEEVMNRYAADGWQVVSTDTVSGVSMTLKTTPLIVTFARRTA